VRQATALAASLGLTLASCGLPSAPPAAQINPIEVADGYAIKHYPREVPRGSARAWLVEDHGEIWTVDMFSQGTAGGGIKMAINKRDGKVMGSERTQ
jgi:hypothetical protein